MEDTSAEGRRPRFRDRAVGWTDPAAPAEREGLRAILRSVIAPTSLVDGPALAARLARRVDRPLTRFAPAPTGALHLGHIVNAILVWGVARALGGRVLLRVEDHDRQRTRAGLEAALLDDLDWLGLAPDIHPTSAFRAGRCDGRQSDRDAVYREALEPLIGAGLVYGCDCSRRQIEAQSAARTSRIAAPNAQAPSELHYPGTCRARGLPLVDGIGWRVRISEDTVRFGDGCLGRVEQTPVEQCGDVLVRDRLSNWTYQWAATVDDARQGITLVVRGVDLLESTGRQILLGALAGRGEPAAFAHHPVLMKSAAQKLSKSDGDSGIRELRSAGWTPGRVLGEAAAIVGLVPEPVEIQADNLASLFRLT